MGVKRLYVKSFRNLAEQTVDFSDSLNLIIGDNGSGKSSVLEALFFIGHGKSFRTTKSDALINVEEHSFIVNAKDQNDNVLGVSKNKADSAFTIKINGQRKQKLSDLVKTLAVQVITPESFKLFFGGAKERRKFLDLGLFHVEQSFQPSWKLFSRIIKQRNACLKNGADKQTLSYWTNEFCQASLVITELRRNYAERLLTEFEKWVALLLPNIQSTINIQFYQGWNSKRTLQELLEANLDKDKQMGFTQTGPQKFDFRFLIDKQPLELKLSRGQQKLFLIALTLAQSSLMKQVTPLKPILLIDDVGAELDQHSREVLAKTIDELDCQVVLTAIEKMALEPMMSKDNNYKMFHVKHGEILAISE